jgi:nitroreductase
MENLFVAARARGLGTVPTVFHWFVEDEFRVLLDIAPELEIPLITPLGYPVEFPESLPPALKAIRRPWRTLVHDDGWGNPRA